MEQLTMCELLGMSANVPTDICFSFTGLMKRGGITGPHTDGWGISFYVNRGCCSFHDFHASAHSKISSLLCQYPIKSHIVISHIRKANRGRVCLENTHPFRRELWGRHWTFAHNGQLKGIKKRPLSFYNPVGTTDSEHAFCWILNRIRERFGRVPDSGSLRRFVGALCKELDEHGVFNILLSDSRHLFCYCSTNLCWLTRQAPFGEAHLLDEEMTVDFAQETTPADIVTVIATRPLTVREDWAIMEPGELIAFRDGLAL